MNNASTGRGRVWMGAVSAVCAGWLGFLCVSWTVIVITNWADGSASKGSDWQRALGYISMASAFPMLSFGAGLVCAFFWHPVVSKERALKWGAWVTLVLLLPQCCFLLIAYLPCLWVFNQGLDCGYKWWPQRAWRTFFGLSNSWERDETE